METITCTELKKFIFERYQYHKQKKLAEETTQATRPAKQQYITITRWMIEKGPKS